MDNLPLFVHHDDAVVAQPLADEQLVELLQRLVESREARYLGGGPREVLF